MGLLPSDLFSVVSTSTTLDIDLSSLSTGTATASPSLATIGSTRQANSLTSPKDSKLSATLYDLAATSATAAPTSFIVIDAFAENGDTEALLEDLRGLGLIEGTSFLNVVSGLLLSPERHPTTEHTEERYPLNDFLHRCNSTKRSSGRSDSLATFNRWSQHRRHERRPRRAECRRGGSIRRGHRGVCDGSARRRNRGRPWRRARHTTRSRLGCPK